MSESAEASDISFWGEANDTRARERVRTLASTLDEGIYQLDTEGRVVAVNDAVVEMVGKAHDDLLGESISVIFENSATIEQEIDRLRANPGERGEPLELTARTGDDEPVQLDVRMSLLQVDGTSRGAVGIVRDATRWPGTDERESERERELQARSAAMERSIDGMAILDENGTYVSVNQAHADIYGYDDPAALLGETWRLCYDDDHIEYIEREAMSTLHEEGSWRGEATGTQADGTTFPQEVSLTLLDDGRYVCVVRDVTERNRRKRSRQRVVQALETAWEGISLLDEDGEFIYVNDAYADTFGYDQDEMVGRHWEELGIEDDPEQFYDEILPRITEDGHWSGRTTCVRSDGTTFPGQHSLTSTEDEDLICVVRDVAERKERERKLEESERRYRTLAESFPNGGVGVYDDDLRYTLVTGTMWDDIESDAADIEGNTIWEALPPETADDVEPVLQGALEGETGNVVSTLGGRTYRIWATPLRDADREIIAGQSVAVDITDQIERQQELRQHARIVETVEEGVYTLDADSRFTMVNDAYCELTGYDREELIGEKASILHSEAIDATVSREVEELEAEDRQTMTTNVELDTADGDTLPVEARVTPFTFEDGSTGRAGVVRDVTERKQRDRTLEQHRAITRAASDAIIAVDETSTIRSANPAVETIFGYEPEEILGEPLMALMPESLEEKHLDALRQYLSSGERTVDWEYLELPGLHRGGHEVPLAVSFSEYEHDGETFFAGIIRDNTERVEHERRLEELVDELEESNERLEQFAYAASHDLQEPLRMVSSYVQMIERRYGDELDEDGQEFVEFAVDGADRMRDMIDGLLEYSRVDTHGDPFEPVELDAVLDDVRDDLQIRIGESDAEITAESLPRVDGDAGQLRQLFQNVVQNAIEYSGDEPPRVHVSAERDGDEWVLSVSDEGIGIDPDDADHVFGVFQSLHTNDEHEGTGIGLAITERIVERHGGDIWVESERGDGTTFSFTLPVEDEAREETGERGVSYGS